MSMLSSADFLRVTLESILLASVSLQAVASVLALRLIRIAGGRLAWVLISVAVGTMALRRAITLVELWLRQGPVSVLPSDLAAELVALCTSALFLGGIAAVAPHLTQMKRNQRKVQESKKTLDAIVAASPVGLCAVRRGRMEWANEPLLAMLGYGRGEWEKQPVQIAFASQAHYHEVNLALMKALRKSGHAALDCRLVTRQGRRFDAYLQARPLDVNDLSLGIIFAATDITERNKVQKALLDSEEKYRTVVNHANDAIFILQDERIQFPNQRALEVLGKGREHLEGMPYVSMVYPEDQEAVLKGLADTLSGLQRLENHQHRVIVDGQVSWMDINAVPIKWQGRPAVLCFARDLTSQKRLERQFLHAQKMEALGRLAGGVAHDFNNLLQVITGYSELIHRQLAAKDPSYEHISNVLESSRRASRLTSQLLTFSRENLTETQELEINDLVSGLEKMLRRIIGEDVALETDLKPNLGYVTADLGRLEQVVMNLTINARDAMPHGGKLSIETDLVVFEDQDDLDGLPLEPGQYNLLTITDSGTGMSQEVMSHLFEPFFTTKEGGKGTGLGLSTAYGIVKAAGGEILVDSEPGKGSRFRIYLPSAKERRRPRECREEGPTPLITGSETVLLVEDEEQVRKLLAETLRLSGYEVLTAANGEEALKIMDSLDGRVHLLITDVVMPKMSGPQLVSQIKKTQPNTKVLFISGYTDNAEILNKDPGKSSHFIQKPFTVESLGKKVREVLANSKC